MYKAMYRFLDRVRDRITDWCLDVETVSIEELHSSLNPHSCEIYNEGTDDLKFVEQTSPNDILIKTPTGFSPIIHTHKTVEYDVWELKTTNHTLKCADTHIVIDQYNNERFIEALYVGEMIQTVNGLEPVMSVKKLDIEAVQMYDIELDDNKHLYYTDGIVSHNSITSAIYLLWFAMFHFDKVILISSNKNAGAMEMIHRIRFAYEELPHFLKPGISEDAWNKHELGFDNGSRIISTATSEDAGRGMSISLLFLDEFAFVPPNIQELFWTSISPTLSTGGSCIMTSTPNGDNNLFAQIWRSAEVGSTVGADEQQIGFRPLRVRWDEPPGRGEAFKQQQISILGQLKWSQEYECLKLDTKIDLMDAEGREFSVTFGELIDILSEDTI